MKEFLKFKVSDGSSSQDISEAGTYYIPIDSILVVDNNAASGTGVNTFIVWQNTPNTSGNVNFYTFELNTPPTNETFAAFNKALEANPGGRSIELQLPTGQEIEGWQTSGEGTY